MAYEESVYSKYSAENLFTGAIDMNGDIYSAGIGRNRSKVGIDLEKEREYQSQIAEMQERLDQYYNKLVELEVITVPKSAEEIAQEQAAQQAEINQALLEAIGDLKSELGELKNGSSRSSDKSGVKPISDDSQNNRKTSSTGKKRDRTGEENAPGNS